MIRIEADGGVTVFHQWTEMGQGVHTVLQQIACQELGLPPRLVRMVVDTTHELDGGQTTASRATVLGGVAIIAAAGKVKGALNGGQLADLAVVYPQSTIAFYRSGGPQAWRGGERYQTADYLRGLYYAVLEGRFLFEFIYQEDLPTAALSKPSGWRLGHSPHPLSVFTPIERA